MCTVQVIIHMSIYLLAHSHLCILAININAHYLCIYNIVSMCVCVYIRTYMYKGVDTGGDLGASVPQILRLLYVHVYIISNKLIPLRVFRVHGNSQHGIAVMSPRTQVAAFVNRSCSTALCAVL